MDDVRVSQWLDQEDRRVSEYIRRYGCSLEYVMPCNGDGTSTPFCYTIGLFGLGHPELLVFGLDQGSASGFLNHLYTMVVKGRDLVPGEELRFPDHEERYLVEEVPNPGDIVFGANRHYRRPSEVSVPVLQLTWSVGGAFPWEAGYPYPAHRQPRPGTFSARVEVDGAGSCDCGC
ncbi:DUF4262 domain-containing protein [Intrasporangium flavum]|uniref:DUF4262 domain-containing protein n=1 Tax=Intrasporangium flavum TaxID=1428657 RepID=UPI00096DB4E8|nr:DUF4262 domain-containing protein [Intrasporangium flavum]